MLSDIQADRLSNVSIPFDDGGRVESQGEPRPRAKPTPLPCHGPDCDTIMVTYLTDADKEATPTAEIQRIHPATGEPRRTTFWFCSEDCRTVFTRSTDREGALLDAGETLDREATTATTDGGTAAIGTEGEDEADGEEIDTAPTLDPDTHNQIVAVVQRSPDVSVAGVLGQLNISPSQADAVAAIIENPVAVPTPEAREEGDLETEDTRGEGQSDDDDTTDGVIEVEPARSPTEIVDERPEERDDTGGDDDALDQGLDDPPTDGKSTDTTPDCESENTTEEPLTALTDSPLAETPPRAVVSGTRYPPGMIEREYWVPTARDEEKRKRPRAPYITGHSYPAKWGDRLPDDQRPETDFETVRRWASYDADELATRGYSLPASDLQETLQVGGILPRDRPPQSDRITLIDWDDVRNPETGEIHPICAAFLRRLSDAYADISTSGTGIHQLVYGGLGEGGKFIAHIDDEPAFDCLDSGDGQDDWPQVEIYDGGRHIAMTGQHVEGSGGDLVDGQECIETLVEKFADAATALPRGMTSIDSADADRPVVTDTRDMLTVDEDGEESGHRAIAIGELADYGGYELDNRPDDRPRCYHAALCNRADPNHKPIANWESIYYIALLGRAIGLDEETIVEDLREFPTPGYGFDAAREPSEVESAFRHDDSPPSTARLHAYGILPSPGCDPDCPAHAPGTAQVKRSGDTGTDEHYRQMPMWAMRNVAYGAGHKPTSDIWRSVETGQAVTDDEDEARQIQQEDDDDLYRALPAKAHNLTLDIIEDAGRHPDEHGRSRRTLTDDSVLYTPDKWK